MITDIAHQYRKQHAQHSKNSLKLSYLAVLGFLRYILPSITILVFISLTFFPFDSYANPQGFSSHPLTNPYPQGFGLNISTKNTVKGVLDNGHTDDYVLLEGYFVENDQLKDAFEFKDSAGDSIRVNIPQQDTYQISYNQMYFVWGTISKQFLSTSINVVDFTPIR